MRRFQAPDEVIDCDDWPLAYADEPSYPEGSRDKTALRAPPEVPAHLIRAGHRYLFKYSDHRYPAQFWGEVFAYRLGSLIGIVVPPAHVALRENQAGALIEWFYDEAPRDGEPRPVCTLGGELMLRRDPDYDRENGVLPGHCHNLDDVMAILTEQGAVDWTADLTRMLILDALIGNNDRHHDNWGVVEVMERGQRTVRMTPAFDNGTSLAHERHEAKLKDLLSDPAWVQRHAKGDKARHHLRIHRQDSKGAKYFDLLAEWFARFPAALAIARQCVNLDEGLVAAQLEVLTRFEVPVRMSRDRAALMQRIVAARRRRLAELIDACR